MYPPTGVADRHFWIGKVMGGAWDGPRSYSWNKLGGPKLALAKFYETLEKAVKTVNEQ